MVSRESGSSPQISPPPQNVQGPQICCISEGGGRKQHPQAGSFAKGLTKGLFTEMQVGSVKATRGSVLVPVSEELRGDGREPL